MNWASLYTARRTGDPENKNVNPDRNRTSYIRDYDRLIFSSAFRRLQNKTQVFPLPGAVFVHNRLTHSLEVASVGRSLGKEVGERIAAGQADEQVREFYRYELPSVVAAACLAHDIGNPPFGHSGEDAIRTFFAELEGEERRMIDEELSDNQRLDFEKFEGNSNALRILTHHFNEDEPGGYKLTYTTLASIVKYPCSSEEGFNKQTGLVATKKSGFFDGEKETYRHIADTMQIPLVEGFSSVYARHPFVYLTEAADDICYRVIDLEDAHRLHIVSYDEFMDLFLPFFSEKEGYNSAAYVEKKLASLKDDNQKVQFMRAKWIGLMVEKLSALFMERETAILAGSLQQDLLSCLPEADHQLIGRINDFSVKRIYNYRSVIEIEAAGYNVIGGLLREFVTAVLHPERSKSKKVLQLIPAQFAAGRNDLYGSIQSVVDFISGMTDLYAIDLYRKLTGISVPEIR